MKAREVRNRCQGKVDLQVLHCIEALAEHQSVIREQLLQLATIVQGMQDLLMNNVIIAENMKSALDMMKSTDPEDGDDGPTH